MWNLFKKLFTYYFTLNLICTRITFRYAILILWIVFHMVEWDLYGGSVVLSSHLKTSVFRKKLQ